MKNILSRLMNKGHWLNLMLAAVALLLTSCKHELKEGTVVNMHVEPERSYMYMMPIPHTISTGKTTSTYYTYIPIMMYDDRDFVITLHGTTKDGEVKDETFYLSEATYNRLKLGQQFCVNEDCSKSPNKDTKRD